MAQSLITSAMLGVLYLMLLRVCIGNSFHSIDIHIAWYFRLTWVIGIIWYERKHFTSDIKCLHNKETRCYSNIINGRVWISYCIMHLFYIVLTQVLYSLLEWKEVTVTYFDNYIATLVAFCSKTPLSTGISARDTTYS